VLDDFVVQAQVDEKPWTSSMEPEPAWTVQTSDGRWVVVSSGDVAANLGAAARQAVDDLAASRDRAALAAHLTSLGIRNSPVRTARDLWDEPPDPLYWVDIEHPEVGTRRYVRPPYRFVPHQDLATERAPLHGEHTFDVLRTLLGLSDTELAALRERGII
jgi:crotonobetainyl-CoA:carnitine CoA-transferase CaiB-like acyl-CoA transferase